MSERFDAEALKQGASVTMLFAAPFQIAALVVRDHNDTSGWLLPLNLITLFGFFLGAGVAAWRQQRRTPLTHGIVTAAGTYIVVEGIFVIIKLVRGGDIRWLAAFFTLSTTVLAGTIGGLFGMTLQSRGIEPKR